MGDSYAWGLNRRDEESKDDIQELLIVELLLFHIEKETAKLVQVSD